MPGHRLFVIGMGLNLSFIDLQSSGDKPHVCWAKVRAEESVASAKVTRRHNKADLIGGSREAVTQLWELRGKGEELLALQAIEERWRLNGLDLQRVENLQDRHAVAPPCLVVV